MLENSPQDIILLWQEVGLDDHFHLSFLSIQANVLEAGSLSSFVFAIWNCASGGAPRYSTSLQQTPVGALGVLNKPP